ncbi:MAG: hypothetical protein AAB922_06315 [Patescibacteria group bacterium]
MRFFGQKDERGPASRQGGQILLVVVLAAVISLTVGLSVASRVVTNTKVATDEADSQKALSAAEAGIDQLVKDKTKTNSSISFGNNSSVIANNIALSSAQLPVNGGNVIAQDDGADIWLSTYPNYTNQWTGNLKIYWTDNSTTDCTKNAALEIVLIAGAVANPDMDRYVYDSCGTRRTSNHFTNPTTVNPAKTILGKKYTHSVFIPVFAPNSTPGIIARVIPLYANTSVAIEGYIPNSTVTTKILPAQGSIIDSTGIAGNATRKVRVFQGYPKLPAEYFPYSLFLP